MCVGNDSVSISKCAHMCTWGCGVHHACVSCVSACLGTDLSPHAPELVSPARSLVWLLCCGRGGQQRDTPHPGMGQALEHGAGRPPQSNDGVAWLRPVVIPETASALLGPIRRKGATPLLLGVCSWPFPASHGAQQTHPPPCLLPGRRLTHDLFIKSHYLCQRRTELLAF